VNYFVKSILVVNILILKEFYGALVYVARGVDIASLDLFLQIPKKMKK